ncbi:unnamed protein product [Umbelopsis ramanniana]
MKLFGTATLTTLIIQLSCVPGRALAVVSSSASLITHPLTIPTASITTSTASPTLSNPCQAYPATGVCSSYVNYPVYMGNTSIKITEIMLEELEYLKNNLSSVNPQCVDNMFRFQCSQMYAKCDTSSSGLSERLPACLSTCNQVLQTCTQTLTSVGYSGSLPNCSSSSFTSHLAPASDGSCNNLTSQVNAITSNASAISLPSGYILPVCPAPFLKDPLAQSGTNNSVSPDTCSNGCCVPCPVQEYLYPEGWIVNGFLATNIIRTISTACTFFLVVSYAILPDKRTHPSLLIFEFLIALFFYSGSVLFSLGDPKRIQCSTDIVNSTQQNNLLCAAQGAIVIYSTLAMALWNAAVIVNLHLHTVWNSKFLVNKYIILNIICWGGPLIVTAITLAYHQVKFEFANLCLVSADWIHRLFFDPLAAIVIPSCALHLATFFHIARVSMKESSEFEMSTTKNSVTNSHLSRPAVSHRRHVVTAVKIQWRALLLALNALVAFLFYWFPKLADLQNNKEVLAEWVTCMMTKQDQNYCANVISSKLPPFALMILAETWISLIGIVVFIIFGKRSLWREWNDWIYEMRMRFITKKRHYPKQEDQFFAL